MQDRISERRIGAPAKGAFAKEELVCEDAEGPEIDGGGIAAFGKDLGGWA